MTAESITPLVAEANDVGVRAFVFGRDGDASRGRQKPSQPRCLNGLREHIGKSESLDCHAVFGSSQ